MMAHCKQRENSNGVGQPCSFTYKNNISTLLEIRKNKINYSKGNLLLDLHCFSCLEKSICMVLPGLLVFLMWNFLYSFCDSLPLMMTKQVIFLLYNTLFSFCFGRCGTVSGKYESDFGVPFVTV